MTVAELQTDLIKLIVHTNDSTFLKDMLAFFKTHQQQGDWWETISEYEKEMMGIGEKEIEEGRGIPYDQVRSEINQILKKN